MKKILISAVVVAAMAAGSMALASPAIMGKHAGKKGKADAAVNCAYCHDAAKIEKKAGQDHAKLQAGESCALAGCHKK